MSTLGDDFENHLRIHTVIEVGDATGHFYEYKVCNRCESVRLISSELTANCLLISTDEQTTKEVDVSYSSLCGKSLGSSMCCERTLVEENFDNALLSNLEKMDSSACKDNILCLNNDTHEKHKPFDSENGKGLTPSCMRCRKGGVCHHSEKN